MRRYVVLAAMLTSLAACGSPPVCTLIGARTGVRLEIRPPFAARVTAASLTACHDGTCRTVPIRLRPSATTRPGGCADGTCSGTAVPTGGRQGFADVPGLPERPVRVTVVLRGAHGERLMDRTVTVTPQGVFPNGRRCGEAGRQASVVIEDGRLHAGG